MAFYRKHIEFLSQIQTRASKRAETPESRDDENVQAYIDREAEAGRTADGVNFTLPKEGNKIAFSIEFPNGELKGASLEFNLAFSDAIQFCKTIDDFWKSTGKSKNTAREMSRDMIISMFAETESKKRINAKNGYAVAGLICYLAFTSEAKQALMDHQKRKGIEHLGYIVTHISGQEFNFRLVAG